MRFTSEEVELLLQVARDGSSGNTFLERLEALTEALSALVPNTAFSAIVLDLEHGRAPPPTQVYYKNGNVADFLPYATHYINMDPMRPAIPRGDGHAYLLSDFVPDRQFGKDEFTSDYLKLLNVRRVMGTSQHMPDGLLLSMAVHRDRGLRDFTDREREILRLVTPDVTRAAFTALLQERVRALQASGDGGTVVVGPMGEVVHTDRRGASLLESATGSLGLPNDLAREARRLSASAHPEGTSRQCNIVLPGGTRLRATLSTTRKGPGANILVVLEPLLPGSPAFVEAIFGQARLSQRERRIAQLAIEGRGYREIAFELGIRPRTIKFHLGNIYRKVGVPGRAELAAIALGRA